MKATSQNSSIKRWETLLTNASIVFSETPSGREITFKGPGPNGGFVTIQINHNGESHWTIRIPGTAKDGMRFAFGVDIEIDAVAKLVIINGILAIRYQ